MGTWGFCALEDDVALDVFDDFLRKSKKLSIEETKIEILNFVQEDYNSICLLGIKMIEVSILGSNFDDFEPIKEYKEDYELFLEKLKKIDFSENINDIRKRIEYVKLSDKSLGWREHIYKQRVEYIDSIFENLKKYK